MHKKILKISAIFFIILTFSMEFILGNLTYYAVYYAKHTPHREGVEPVFMEVIDSLSCIYQPNIEGIEYRFDGNPILYNANNFHKYPSRFSNHNSSGHDKGYHFNDGDWDGESSLTYTFDKRFTLVKLYNEGKPTPDLNSIDVALVKRKIYQAVQPVVDAQPEPFIDLQWLYDLINKDRFNWE